MRLHTYRRKNGSYYDAERAETPFDETLPLRPSEIHEWDGRQWVWSRNDVRHATPRVSDTLDENTSHSEVVLSYGDLAALLRAIQEAVERIECAERGQGDLRGQISHIREMLIEHLAETEALVALAKDLQASGRITRFVGKHFLPILIGAITTFAVLWSLAHGDFGPLKKVFGLS